MRDSTFGYGSSAIIFAVLCATAFGQSTAIAQDASTQPLIVQSFAYPVYANKPGRLRLPIKRVTRNDGMKLSFTLVDPGAAGCQHAGSHTGFGACAGRTRAAAGG